MAVTRLQTVGRGRDREGLMPAIAGRNRDRQRSNQSIQSPPFWVGGGGGGGGTVWTDYPGPKCL